MAYTCMANDHIASPLSNIFGRLIAGAPSCGQRWGKSSSRPRTGLTLASTAHVLLLLSSPSPPSPPSPPPPSPPPPPPREESKFVSPPSAQEVR